MSMQARFFRSVLAGAAALALAASAAAAEDKVLHVYNWVDYIGETTIADFEKETGIKVVYDTYDSSETVDAKLMAGRSGYDVVIHAASFIPRLIKAGAFEELDRGRLANYKNMDPAILEVLAGYDEGNATAVPYMWGTTGISYNVDLVKKHLPDAPIGSADMIFKPEYMSKLAECGVTFLDDPSSVIPMALAYLGLDPNSTNKSDYKKVAELLSAVRPYIRTFDSSNYLNALPNEEICVAMTWSGDYAVAAGRAEEAGKEVNLAYFMPNEGSVVWFDVWVVPKDAPHKEAAYKWLDYMMRPEVIAGATNYTWYANANTAAKEFVEPDILADPAVYPPEEAKKSMFSNRPLPQKANRTRTRTWSRIKTGQ